ncbi:MAG: PspC domain-containing protein [Acidimicrobiia bacterium]
MANPSPSAPPTPYWQIPRLPAEGRILTGTAKGLADELGVEAIWVRVAFVVLAATGWGALFYVAAWLILRLVQHSVPEAAPYHPVPKASSPLNRLLALGMATAGLVALLRDAQLAFGARITVPATLVGLGAVVAWQQSGRSSSLISARLGAAAPLWRVAAGLTLAAAGLAVLAFASLDVRAAALMLLVAGGLVGGVGLLVAPWLRHLVGDLAEERNRRVRSEERARMAAHLHDSVLQTLALIQRNAHDPARMTSLARRQERELRTWLYGEAGSAVAADLDAATGSGGPVVAGLRGALERIAVEVEELHGVPIEVVVVGDVDLAEPTRELAAAAREAMVNAAKHSGAPRIDVFAELRPELAEVFVRDLGKGFDPATVAADRAGLASSIHGRMGRIGGSAAVVSHPGDGTEVELRLPHPAGGPSGPGRGSGPASGNGPGSGNGPASGNGTGAP